MYRLETIGKMQGHTHGLTLVPSVSSGMPRRASMPKKARNKDRRSMKGERQPPFSFFRSIMRGMNAMATLGTAATFHPPRFPSNGVGDDWL
jgi:hypothetical protein